MLGKWICELQDAHSVDSYLAGKRRLLPRYTHPETLTGTALTGGRGLAARSHPRLCEILRWTKRMVSWVAQPSQWE